MSVPLPVARPIGENRLLQVLVLVYAVAWVWSGWAPVSRQTWVLENLLVVGAVLLLAASHRRFPFSNLSNLLLAAFLLLHAVGSHYTYSAVPLGDWARDAFGLTRNHYDRFVHLAFGLLLAYPLREVILRRAHAHGTWSWLLPLAVVLALSGGYEVVEWAAARITDPDVGIAFVGAQGDVWDGQKDMGLAFLGACLALAAAALLRRATGHEAYLLLRG